MTDVQKEIIDVLTDECEIEITNLSKRICVPYDVVLNELVLLEELDKVEFWEEDDEYIVGIIAH